ncbi:anthranilate synthase component I [uncultured Thermanaerothrix sp.]|uniref:anthranilate synthase component I n=1 Tax=uncultured Thermanaerothrix sp. TaxID=1195149 RepID=UPI002617CC87|nr:anthranilate synthase component I [uncultured Thermanaerothrix sp.]
MVSPQFAVVSMLADGTQVYELPADTETPVSAYLKVASLGPAFLLESVVGGERLGRYSFIGLFPEQIWVLRSAKWEIYNQWKGTRTTIPIGGDPLAVLQPYLQPSMPAVSSSGRLPRFTGGWVGYLGYELARYFEPVLGLTPDLSLPESILLETGVLIVFDHAFNKMLLLARPGSKDTVRAEERLAEVMARLRQSRLPTLPLSKRGGAMETRSTFSRDRFLAAVAQTKEYIAAGEIFQAVLSQRLIRPARVHPFQIYRALRRLNPSPYMFYFDFGEIAGEPFYLIGASPELHVRLEAGQAMMRPIAGTRPRGTTTIEDLAHEADLLADPKERAEHIMLVDLARNDLGRVCEYGSVKVPERMIVERYSHVMHIVSQVEGRLRPEVNALDLLRATFPAGTVSGAPKIRAMQIIRDLEPHPRGPYAGVTGYVGWDGNMDTCITIRTMFYHGDRLIVQAGAGIVADSLPEREYEETLNKARALLVAVDLAETESR